MLGECGVRGKPAKQPKRAIKKPKLRAVAIIGAIGTVVLAVVPVLEGLDRLAGYAGGIVKKTARRAWASGPVLPRSLTRLLTPPHAQLYCPREGRCSWWRPRMTTAYSSPHAPAPR